MAQPMYWFSSLLGSLFVVGSSVAVHQSSVLGKAGSDLLPRGLVFVTVDPGVEEIGEKQLDLKQEYRQMQQAYIL
jgi:hypothetical protein